MDMKTVKFKFSPAEKVKTPVGTEGIIDTCSLNVSGTIMYLVEESALTRWWNEDQLSLVTETEKEANPNSEG